MNKDAIINKTAEYVRGKLEGEGSGHDWWHIVRVWNLAKRIGEEEGANMFIVELTALLHDIADSKFHNGDHTVGPRVASEWLSSLKVENEVIGKVAYIIEHMSFSASMEKNKITRIEGKTVQDADRLDAIGAIGIGRTFTYGGKKSNVMYDPDMPYREELSATEYAKDSGKGVPTINHFYEKLLNLKDTMNTKTGKEIASARHIFMEEYLAQFFAEWEGER